MTIKQNIDADIGIKLCDHHECNELGEFRAPKSKAKLRDFYWFCLSHIRDYNAKWNFCEGMDIDDMEKAIKDSYCWERPTWPFNAGSVDSRKFYSKPDIKDGFNFDEDIATKRRQRQNKNRAYLSEEEKSLEIMGFNEPPSLIGLKKRYKQLAKDLHPDINGQNKQSEERLKIINQAYTILKKILL